MSEKTTAISHSAGSTMAIQMGFTKEQIEVIKSTVAKNSTDTELAMFLSLAKKYELDPFAKDIWFIKYEGQGGGTPTIMTSRDGYLKIAQRDNDFRGINSGVVRSNDEFEIDWDEFKIKHKMNLKDKGDIVGAWAICKHEKRDPVIVFVQHEEYKKPDKDKWGKTTVWGQYPSAMIQKVAEAFALKRQFGISGLVTQEEIADETKEEFRAVSGSGREIPSENKSPAPSVVETPATASVAKANEKQIADIKELIKEHKYTAKETKEKTAKLLEKFQVKSFEEMSYKQADECKKLLASSILQKAQKEATPETPATAEVAGEVFEGEVIEN